MEEVNELLKTWELDDLIPVFNKQQITIQALSALTDDDIKEMIPLTGPRSLFKRCWRAWKAEFSCTLFDLSLFDADSLETNKDIIVVPHSSVKEKENQPPVVHIHNEGSSSQCLILENLLKESLDSASLLTFKGRCLAGDSARNLLAGVIGKAILTENKGLPITGATYYKWANHIKELFPGERTTTYYIPACTTANGIVLQAKGKLVHQVLNKRRRLQNLGALPKAKRKLSREESPACSLESNQSPRPLPNIFSDEEENENIENDIQWLENSSEPWSIVEEKWENTFKIRTRAFYDTKTNEAIETYFEKYPSLKKPQGYSLLVIKDALFSEERHEIVIKTCRKIVGHFKRSEQASRKLIACQKRRGIPTHSLIQDVEVRWNSTYNMLERLLEQKTAVNLYSVEHDRIDTLSSSDWELMKNLTQVLKFFYEATLDLSFDNACISIVIPLIALLNRKLQFRDENESEVMRSMKTKLHESMNRRFAYVQDEVDIATMEIENHMRIYADNSRETAGTSGQEPSSSYRLSPYEKMAGFGMSMTNRLVKQFKVLMQ
ncbi:Zinc finger BED domain-containing protein 4 [Eumeta japonica]|uniref:Zinc finger BED domain-containing protein 4 n=1 Tax=Eumeta variegata TaxID=151549 RepID=A0A4C1WNQ7_EUMVA|nr:Zinc finger BED domain-containing protein 4 [Eumeta japonica]